jgi:hypothetical protein
MVSHSVLYLIWCSNTTLFMDGPMRIIAGARAPTLFSTNFLNTTYVFPYYLNLLVVWQCLWLKEIDLHMIIRDGQWKCNNTIVVVDGGCILFFTSALWCIHKEATTLKLARSQGALRIISEWECVHNFVMGWYIYRFLSDTWVCVCLCMYVYYDGCIVMGQMSGDCLIS